MMPARMQALPLCALSSLVLAGFLSACSSSPQALGGSQLVLMPNLNATPINRIALPQNSEPTVQVQGKVTRIVPLAGMQAYALQDNSGSVWVLTRQAAPSVGQVVSVQGTVRYQSIPLGGQEFGEIYIEAQDQTGSKPAAVPNAQT